MVLEIYELVDGEHLYFIIKEIPVLLLEVNVVFLHIVILNSYGSFILTKETE